MNKKIFTKTLHTFFGIVFILSVIFFLKIIEYKDYTKAAKDSILVCNKKNKTILSVTETFIPENNGCYEKMYHLLLPKLLTYKVKYKGKDINIVKCSDMLSFVNELVEDADAVLNWGIFNDIDFEKYIAEKYNIPVYSFDCGSTKEEEIQLNKIHPNLIVRRECLGTDKYLMYNQKSSNKIHSLSQKLDELHLKNKKVYLKFGIPELQEYKDDIFKNKDNILGFTFHIDIWSPKYAIDLNDFLNELDKEFVLVFIDPIIKKDIPKIKYISGVSTRKLSVIYINKSILDDYYIPLNQNNRKINKISILKYHVPYMSVNPIIVATEKIKSFRINLHHKINILFTGIFN